MECFGVFTVVVLAGMGVVLWRLQGQMSALTSRLDHHERELGRIREALLAWKRAAAAPPEDMPAKPVPPPVQEIPVAPPPPVEAPAVLAAPDEAPFTVTAPAPTPEPPEAPAPPPVTPPPPAIPPPASLWPNVPSPFPEERRAAHARPAFDWEGLVGVKLFSWIAGILLVLAAIQFLRYSIEHGWLSPPIRMAFGFATGIALLVVCELRLARRYAVTANAMDAAGVAILFATTFAGYSLWGLLGGAVAFGLMAAVTAFAVWLSLRRDSLFIALLGLIGGFATPALLSTGQDRPIPLFGYLLLLNAGLAWVALRRSWPVLSGVTLAFTTLYQWGWVLNHLDEGELPLAAGIFLAFPALAFAVPLLARPVEDDGSGRLFKAFAGIGAALPLLFAVYLATVSGYGKHYGLLFGFLLILDAGLALIAARRGPQMLHLAGAGATVLIVLLWLAASYDGAAWPDVLGLFAALILFYRAAPWLLERLGSPLDGDGRLGTLVSPLLLLSFLGVMFRETAAGDAELQLAALLLLTAALAGFSFLDRDRRLVPLSFTAAGLVLIIWGGPAGDDAESIRQALGAATALAVLAGLGLALARRRGGELFRAFAHASLIALLFGQGVLFEGASAQHAPSLAWLIPLQIAFLAALLALDSRREWRWPGPVSVPLTAVTVIGWVLGKGQAAAAWTEELDFAAAIYVVYLAWPLVLGERARRLREPFLTAVLASIPFFFFARHALIRGGWEGALGLLPLTQAAALSVLLWRLLRLEPAGQRDPGRLALVAGAVLAGVTLAVPLQLEKEWLTLGWALLAAALAWLYGRIPHRGLLLWCAGLLTACFVRLALNPAVLEYHPRTGVPVWNQYLYIYLVPAAAFFLAAWLLARTEDRLLPALAGVSGGPRLSSLANGGATVLLFLLLNVEIADLFSRGDSLTFGFLSGHATLAEDLTYTLGWAVFAVVLLVAGIALRRRPARIAAIVLLLGAVLKGFLHDLAQLGGLYKVGSFVGLAAALALVAVLIQRFVLSRSQEE